MKSLIVLAVILLATFGAGTVDVLFPDVIPLRPYTGVFQAAHSLSQVDNGLKASLPLVPVLIAALVLSLFTLAIFVPHIMPSLGVLPLGSRGSHSRANRRAGAGWTNKEDKAPVKVRDQLRILMEIFGRPRVVIIYDKQKTRKEKG